ncbi:MAG: hypothetical protein ACLQJF_19875 [Candidatus Sulfotelmatobacter sp.]
MGAVRDIQTSEHIAPSEPGTLAVPHQILEFVVVHKDVAIDVSVRIVIEVWNAAWQRWGKTLEAAKTRNKSKSETADNKAQQEESAVLQVGANKLKLPADAKAIKDFIDAVSSAEGKKAS